jgi:AcrR family transcriptional regulator
LTVFQPMENSVFADDEAPGRGKRRRMTPQATTHLTGAKGRDHEVLNAAIDLFWEKGYAATSMQDVADRLGMLKGSLYYYIKGKEDLLKRIFQDSHAEGLAIIASVSATEAPAVVQLETFLTQWALWHLTHVKRTSLYSREWRHAGPALRKVLVEQRQRYEQMVTDLVTEAQQDGALDPKTDAKLAAFYVMSAISALPDWYKPGGSQKPEAVAATYTAFSMRLLGART